MHNINKNKVVAYDIHSHGGNAEVGFRPSTTDLWNTKSFYDKNPKAKVEL